MIFAASSFTFIHLSKNIYFVNLQFTCKQVHAGKNIHLVKSKVFLNQILASMTKKNQATRLCTCTKFYIYLPYLGS